MLLQYTISKFYWLYTDEGTGNDTNTKISLFRSLFQEQSSLDRLITTIIRCVMMKIKIKMMTIIRWHLVMMELMTLILLRSKFPKHYMTGRQDPMILIMIEWKVMTMINELISRKLLDREGKRQLMIMIIIMIKMIITGRPRTCWSVNAAPSFCWTSRFMRRFIVTW